MGDFICNHELQILNKLQLRKEMSVIDKRNMVILKLT